MSNPKFSIIIPCYSEDKTTDHHFRGKTVQRAIKSVIAQQYPDWELILVDDGCSDGVTPDILKKFADSDERIKYVYQENQNRAIARNTGMDNATGEWLCWLDSDDEYSTHYLRELNQATIDFPDYHIFNFGSIVHFSDHHTAVRPAFKPAVEGEGHEWFRSGHIGAGSFIFRRDFWLSDVSYRIPDEVNPYQFAAASKFDMRFDDSEPYVENPLGAFSDGVYRHGLSLGNPWGDDFLQFYRLTRNAHSKPLDVLLYVQYVRAHEGVYDHFGEIYDV
jgi:glycosyltransferase involved in cell wall biosynthesis